MSKLEAPRDPPRKRAGGAALGFMQNENGSFKVKDFLRAQKGSSFLVKVVEGPTDVPALKPSMNLVISIFGVKLFDPAQNQKVHFDYELEQIIMHDYNISTRMFTFRISDSKTLTTRSHTVYSDDYMDIYSYLGRAIALLSFIKEKSQIESAHSTSLFGDALDDADDGPQLLGAGNAEQQLPDGMGIPGIRPLSYPRNRTIKVFRGLPLEDGPIPPTAAKSLGHGTIRFPRTSRKDGEGEDAAVAAEIPSIVTDAHESSGDHATLAANGAANAPEPEMKSSPSNSSLSSISRNKTMKKLNGKSKSTEIKNGTEGQKLRTKRSGGVDFLQTLFGLNFDSTDKDREKAEVKEKEKEKEKALSITAASGVSQSHRQPAEPGSKSEAATPADSTASYEGNRHISEEDDLSNVTVARSMYTKYYIQKRYRMTLQRATMANQQIRQSTSNPDSPAGTPANGGASLESVTLTRSEGSLRSLTVDSEASEGGVTRKASSETSLDDKIVDIVAVQATTNIKRSKSKGGMLNIKKLRNLTIKRKDKDRYKDSPSPANIFDTPPSNSQSPDDETSDHAESRTSMDTDCQSTVSEPYDTVDNSSLPTKGRLSISANLSTGSLVRPRSSIAVETLQRKRHETYGEWIPEALNKVRLRKNAEGREILIENLKQNKYEITAGTIDTLIECLADESPPDTLYIDTFLLTYKHFITSEQLIVKLRERFESFIAPSAPAADGKANVAAEMSELVQRRTVSVVKKWAERHADDFVASSTTKHLLFEFLDSIASTSCGSFTKLIRNLVENGVQADEASFEPIAIERGISETEMIMWSARSMAQQLTLADLELFKTIRPDEFIYWLWGDNEEPKKMKNLTNFINRFNTIGFWVASMICQCTDLKRRSEILEKSINLARHCYKLQNFNAAMAILSGLNTTSVYRLKKTWAGISSRHQAIYKELEAKLSYSSNYKIYRETECAGKPPLIPFFGLYIRDLTFMNDGNQKILANGLINFEKNRAISEKVMAIRVFQQSKFEFASDPKLYPFFLNLPCLAEEVLQEESQKREPPTFRMQAESVSSVTATGVPEFSTEDLSIDSLNLTPSATSSPYSTMDRRTSRADTGSSMQHQYLQADGSNLLDAESVSLGSILRNDSSLSLAPSMNSSSTANTNPIQPNSISS